MSVCIPSFTMASGLVAMGLNPWLAVINVTLGNLIILIPMQLNSHAGTRYGIPFPVFCRETFGPIGAHIPALSRGLTACGWCAIQSWIGGGAIAAIIGVFSASYANWGDISFVGAMVNPGQLIGFFIFLVLVLIIAIKGSEAIKLLQSISAPIIMALCLALLVWSFLLATNAGYSLSDVFNASADEGLMAASGGGLYIFLGGLTANIAFWATMALNIPDFSRYAKNQKAQFNGQLLGMPIPMAACAFIGACFAQSTGLVFGTPMFDPTEVLFLLGANSPALAILAALCVLIVTITTNIAANVVAPANGFSNLAPTKISYKTGVIITCILAILYRPWWIFGGPGVYLFGWLGTYGTILAPIAAIFVADYYIVKKRNLDVMALFQGKEGRYWYQSGWNVRAVIAWVAAFALPILDQIAGIFGGWMVANGYAFSFIVGLIVYVLLMKNEKVSFLTTEEHEALTEKA